MHLAAHAQCGSLNFASSSASAKLRAPTWAHPGRPFCSGIVTGRSRHLVRSDEADRGEAVPEDSPPAAGVPAASGSVRDSLKQAEAQRGKGKRREGESTDWVATQLTRRFGLAGGLAWVGVLTFGVVGEQVKTRLEQASEEANTKEVANAKEVVTPEGLRYSDIKIGGGAFPQRGDLVILDYKAFANGVSFEDTKARGKPIVFLYTRRPLTGGVCKGVELALQSMRAGGSRRVIVPPELGFGAGGLTLRPTEHVPEKQGLVPGNATLEYELELIRVSIPPS